ncbi:MAG TPA: hypothetical protein VGR57_07565, partial [Ktedonobacterales bacterium]|nr:hypothetical protein [Ktedonobacterales bacterium]
MSNDTPHSEPEKQLAQMLRRASDELAAVETSAALDDWRTRYLGRERGEVTAILKTLGRLPDAER